MLACMCQDARVTLGVLWPSLPSQGTIQPGGIPTARGKNQGWVFRNTLTRVLPERCLSVLSKVVGVYLREELLSQTSCF